jgi:hypothetical protein
MSALGDALASLADVLRERGVPWYLFGAQAVSVRGAPRATQDLDVTVDLPRQGVGALVTALQARGFAHRFPEDADRLLHAAAVIPLRHEGGFEVDLVLGGSGLETLTLSRATIVEVEGVSVPVASATDLVVAKVIAGRGKDLEDIRALLATGMVDEPEVEDLLGQLEEALGQSDLIPFFERARRS